MIYDMINDLRIEMIPMISIISMISFISMVLMISMILIISMISMISMIACNFPSSSFQIKIVCLIAELWVGKTWLHQLHSAWTFIVWALSAGPSLLCIIREGVTKVQARSDLSRSGLIWWQLRVAANWKVKSDREKCSRKERRVSSWQSRVPPSSEATREKAFLPKKAVVLENLTFFSSDRSYYSISIGLFEISSISANIFSFSFWELITDWNNSRLLVKLEHLSLSFHVKRKVGSKI